MTGVFTACKVCGETKDDALFKWQKGKRVGLVCRACDLALKREKYATDETERQAAIHRAKRLREEKPDECRARSKMYRERNDAVLRFKKAEYHLANADRINAKTRAWVAANKERHKAVCRANYDRNRAVMAFKRSERYFDNKAVYKEKNRAWLEKNPHLATFYVRKYKLDKDHRTPAWANLGAIREFYRNCPDGMTVDHIIPLRGRLVSGLHVENNLQYLTKSQNSSKQNRFDPLEFRA
jgi:hypothetical protein